MIIIFGAGIAGLFTGYNLLKRGKEIKIIDTNSIRAGSTGASVGMLAPFIEAKPGENELLNLMLDSKKIWEELQLNKKFSKCIDLKENSSLMIGLNEDDKEKN